MEPYDLTQQQPGSSTQHQSQVALAMFSLTYSESLTKEDSFWLHTIGQFLCTAYMDWSRGVSPLSIDGSVLASFAKQKPDACCLVICRGLPPVSTSHAQQYVGRYPPLIPINNASSSIQLQQICVTSQMLLGLTTEGHAVWMTLPPRGPPAYHLLSNIPMLYIAAYGSRAIGLSVTGKVFGLVGFPKQTEFGMVPTKTCSWITVAGTGVMYAIDESHAVLKLGLLQTNTISTPHSIPALQYKRVARIECGAEHCGVITIEGTLFMWGKNCHGQLGLGRTGTSSRIPLCPQYLEKTFITQIALGLVHSIAISNKGDAYVWGGGENGQLGCGAGVTITNLPLTMSRVSFQGHAITSIAASATSSCFVSSNGVPFVCGKNEYAQLAPGNPNTVLFIPTRAELLGELGPKLIVPWPKRLEECRANEIEQFQQTTTLPRFGTVATAVTKKTCCGCGS